MYRPVGGRRGEERRGEPGCAGGSLLCPSLPLPSARWGPGQGARCWGSAASLGGYLVSGGSHLDPARHWHHLWSFPMSCVCLITWCFTSEVSGSVRREGCTWTPTFCAIFIILVLKTVQSLLHDIPILPHIDAASCFCPSAHFISMLHSFMPRLLIKILNKIGSKIDSSGIPLVPPSSLTISSQHPLCPLPVASHFPTLQILY